LVREAESYCTVSSMDRSFWAVREVEPPVQMDLELGGALGEGFLGVAAARRDFPCACVLVKPVPDTFHVCARVYASACCWHGAIF
jgi:hypothetical protein